jgi:polyisoprenoid-binding protein YceI
MVRRHMPIQIERLLGIAFLLLLAAPLAAEDYTIDSVHSSVVFKIGHVGASDFFGRFNNITGVLKFDEENLKESSVRAVVKATSVDTNSADRDGHIRSDEFLNAEAHPELVFEAKGFEKTDKKDTYTVKGKLTFRGVTKDVEVTARKVGTGEFPRGTKRIGFTCTFSIKRTDYGSTLRTKMLSDKIEITVGVEAMIKKEE